MADAPPPPSVFKITRFRLLDFLNILFGLITAASLLLAYYWHRQSIEERMPTYYVEYRASLVSRSVPAPSDLQVLYKGKKLDADVSDITVYLWNSGQLPIKAEDVLESLAIELEPK